MTLTGKIGRFFFLLGGALLLIFFASDLARNPQFNLFFWGFMLGVTGILLMRRGRLPPQPSSRFRLLRSLRSGKKDLPSGEPSEGEEEQ